MVCLREGGRGSVCVRERECISFGSSHNKPAEKMSQKPWICHWICITMQCFTEVPVESLHNIRLTKFLSLANHTLLSYPHSVAVVCPPEGASWTMWGHMSCKHNPPSLTSKITVKNGIPPSRQTGKTFLEKLYYAEDTVTTRGKSPCHLGNGKNLFCSVPLPPSSGWASISGIDGLELHSHGWLPRLWVTWQHKLIHEVSDGTPSLILHMKRSGRTTSLNNIL